MARIWGTVESLPFSTQTLANAAANNCPEIRRVPNPAMPFLVAGLNVVADFVPPFLTRWQFQQGMRNLGQTQLDAFKAYVLALPEEERDKWQMATRIWRNSPMVEAARVTLGYTNVQIDNFFRSSSQIDERDA